MLKAEHEKQKVKDRISSFARKADRLLTKQNQCVLLLLSLQTALFAAFGSGAGEFVPAMNAVTGALVCLMILCLGIYMVYDAKKKLHTKAQIGKETKE